MNDEMRQLLAQAAVMAEASAAAIQDKTSHGKASSTILVFKGRSTFEEMALRFSRCRTPADEVKALEWARGELDSLRGVNRPKPKNERTLLIREWEGYSDAEASTVTGIARTTVRRWREEAGRDPRDGKPFSKFDARSRKAA